MKSSAFFPSHWIVMGLGLLFFCGCAQDQDLIRISQQQSSTIQSLNEELLRLNKEMDMLLESREELEKIQEELERKMQKEVAVGDMSISMQERGLVVTVLERVLFDSGKAALKPSSRETLNKIAQTLSQKLSDQRVYIEGHTDNEPIRYSGWRSNWELSTARATEVVQYLVKHQYLSPDRLAATGYGQYHPVSNNDAKEGRAMNRRVEIVISPQKVDAGMMPVGF